MKVYITGSSGFTGIYLNNLLSNKGIEVISSCVDITDITALINELSTISPDYVVHLAGLSFMGHSDQEAMYRVHIFGTLNLLQALKLTGSSPKKIIIASTAHVYGNPEVSLLEETMSPMPVSHYANSKLAMEYMVRQWFNEFPIIITRAFNYTGIGQSSQFLIPKIIEHFRAEKPTIEMGNLDVIRDFSDVRDVVQMIWKLLQSEASSEIVNICSGKGSAIHDIIRILEKMSGYSMTVLRQEAFVRSNEAKQLVGSTKKCESIIGKIPRISLEDTLSWMFHE